MWLASLPWRIHRTAAAQMEMKIGYGTINDPQHAIAQEIQKRIGGTDAQLGQRPSRPTERFRA